jgi:hypothetical protein
MPAHAVRGVPDIVLIRGDKFVGPEVKTISGRLERDETEEVS